MAQGGAHHHQWRVEVVNQGDVVTPLGIQVAVAVGAGSGVGGVHVRVQVRDARTADAHVVAEADVLRSGGAPLDAGGGYQVAIIHAEGAAHGR